MEVNPIVCPKCNSDETYCVNDWLGYEVRECENEVCKCVYEVHYDIKVRSIKIKGEQ